MALREIANFPSVHAATSPKPRRGETFIARGVSPGLRKKNNRAPEGRHVQSKECLLIRDAAVAPEQGVRLPQKRPTPNPSLKQGGELLALREIADFPFFLQKLLSPTKTGC